MEESTALSGFQNTLCIHWSRLALFFKSSPWPGLFILRVECHIHLWSPDIQTGLLSTIYVLDRIAFQICALTQQWTSSSPSRKQSVTAYKDTHMLLLQPSGFVLFVHGREDDHGLPSQLSHPTKKNLETTSKLPKMQVWLPKPLRGFSLKYLEWLSPTRILPQIPTKRKTPLIKTCYKQPKLFNESAPPRPSSHQYMLPRAWSLHTQPLVRSQESLSPPASLWATEGLFPKKAVYLERQWWNNETLATCSDNYPPSILLCKMSLCETVQIMLKECIPNPSLDNSHVEPAYYLVILSCNPTGYVHSQTRADFPSRSTSKSHH